jgi:hypothetical protein
MKRIVLKGWLRFGIFHLKSKIDRQSIASASGGLVEWVTCLVAHTIDGLLNKVRYTMEDQMHCIEDPFSKWRQCAQVFYCNSSPDHRHRHQRQ